MNGLLAFFAPARKECLLRFVRLPKRVRSEYTVLARRIRRWYKPLDKSPLVFSPQLIGRYLDTRRRLRLSLFLDQLYG